MSLEYPHDLKYLDSHEYVKLDGEIATLGISAFAIDQLGDIVFLELVEVGTLIQKQEKFGTIESVKAVEDLFSAVTGIVLERNDTIIESPERLAADPYGEGWLLKVRIEDTRDLDDALSADEYCHLLEAES